jgi:hypothetical protein
MLTLRNLRATYGRFLPVASAKTASRIIQVVKKPLTSSVESLAGDLGTVQLWWMNPLAHIRVKPTSPQLHWLGRFQRLAREILAEMPSNLDHGDEKLELLWAASGGALYEMAVLSASHDITSDIIKIAGDEFFKLQVMALVSKLELTGDLVSLLESLHETITKLLLLIDHDVRKSPDWPQILRDHARDRDAAVYLLAEVYEAHFGRRFGVSRNQATGQLCGPGIRFMQMALRELGMRGPGGKELSPETIASAWQRTKRAARRSPALGPKFESNMRQGTNDDEPTRG